MDGFISYSHEDFGAFEKICLHLKPVERAFRMKFWADSRIRPGSLWSKKIEQAIEAACLHILVVSPSFLASDYIFDVELPAINAKFAAGDLVVPVIVSRCCWQPFIGALQAVPSANGRLLPIGEWQPKERGFDAAREQLMHAIESHFGVSPTSGLIWSRP